jgi:hypothetical protein
MPIIFDQITADVAPPAPTASTTAARSDNAAPTVDPQALLRELQLVAERAERLKAD